LKKLIKYCIFFGVILWGASCKKQFNPTLVDNFTNYLAVEGTITSGDSTIITLTRTTGLKDTTRKKAELKAAVYIEDDQKVIFPLVEKGKGNYALGVTSFNPDRKYRLNIKTSTGSTYQSDFVPLKVTPPIDSVYFKQPNSESILFYVDTHDATNKTRYYRWEYKETWAYTAYYGGIRNSLAYLRYENVNGNIVDKHPKGLFVGTCYGTAPSNEILIGSSSKIVNDVITGQQIGRLTSNSRKISKLYNMRLYQYAITEEAFNYYQNLKKNTEGLGSIFDPQPSFTIGNIRCISNPAERVLGFVSASTVTAKIFSLAYAQLPLTVEPMNPGDCKIGAVICFNNFTKYVGPPDSVDCDLTYNGKIAVEPQSTFSVRLKQLYSRSYQLMITSPDYGVVNGAVQITHYKYFKRDCIDCLAMPGSENATYTRPSYFPAFQ
jgi:hypothetical protein